MQKQITPHLQNFRNWLFHNEPQTETKSVGDYRPTLLFFVSVLFYCVYLRSKQPRWVLSGQMWAEMATEYYAKATSPSIAIKLFSTDAGYIPLPQRILAALGDVLNLPAAIIPHFYTWSAIVLTGCMVGTFCLKPFRAIAQNDFTRFFAAVSILLIADFESRTFVNFTYFSAFFIAIVTALAFVQKSDEVPRWAWFIPILMVTKPSVLSVLPAMIVISFVSGTRFRLITAISVLLCLAQVLRMMLSHSEGWFVAVNEFSLLDKLDAAFRYFFGFLGAFFAGKALLPIFYRPILFGVVLSLACLFALLKRRTNASALILVGSSLLLFNVVLNVFALSDMWNVNMERLIGVPLYRHIIVGYFGVVLIIAGLIDSFSLQRKIKVKSLSISVGPVLFLFWFYASGWYSFSDFLNQAPRSPTLNNSLWHEMSSAIDSDIPICVPLDPFGWVFGRNCELLNPDIKRTKELAYKEWPAETEYQSITVVPPREFSNKNLVSLALLTKPHTSTTVNGEAVLLMKDGTTKHLLGNRQLSKYGGLLLLAVSDTTPLPIDDIQTITLTFSVPVDIGFIVKKTESEPAILWMGK